MSEPEHMTRLKAMAADDGTWDLSENDVAAIRRAIGEIERLERDIEACRRYFGHCLRVSISARGKGCGSPEMDVRMSLMDEAYVAVGLKEWRD